MAQLVASTGRRQIGQEGKERLAGVELGLLGDPLQECSQGRTDARPRRDRELAHDVASVDRQLTRRSASWSSSSASATAQAGAIPRPN